MAKKKKAPLWFRVELAYAEMVKEAMALAISNVVDGNGMDQVVDAADIDTKGELKALLKTLQKVEDESMLDSIYVREALEGGLRELRTAVLERLSGIQFSP